MNDTLQTGTTRWSHYQTGYPFVCIPKYRRKILTVAVTKVFKAAIETSCHAHGFRLLALETDIDHLHCFVSAEPRWSPAVIVGLLKGYSSRIVRQSFPGLARKTGKDQLWASAYYVGTAGQVSADTIHRYITECQGR